LEIAQITFLDIQESEQHVNIIKHTLEKCYEQENLKGKNIYIDIILTNGEQIRKLNKKYRNVDEETDVLSFPMFENVGVALYATRAPYNGAPTPNPRRYSNIYRTNRKASKRVWTYI